MNIPIEEISRFPPPGMGIPSSFSFSPNCEYIAYLSIQILSGLRTLRVIEFDTQEDVLIFGALEEGSKNESLDEELRRQRDRRLGTGVTHYSWIEERSILIQQNSDLYVVDDLESNPRLLVDGESYPVIDPKVSPIGDMVAFVCRGDIFVIPVSGGIPRKITRKTNLGVTNGLADYIAQEEMRRPSGFWWSLDGQKIAFTQVDETHIPPLHIVHSGKDDTGADAQEIHRYPFSGQDNPKVKLGVISMDGSVKWLNTEKYEYLARIDWVDSNKLAVQCQNREQTRLDLLIFGQDMELQNILALEKSDRWINISDSYRFLGDDRFLWASERDGWRHIYLYEADDPYPKQITRGEWQVDELLAWDKDKGAVYFTATEESPLDKHVYACDLKGRSIRKITVESGIHNAVISPNFELFVDTYHSLTSSPMNTIKSLCGQLKPISVLNETDNRAVEYALRPPEIISIEVPSGQILYGAIYRPDEKFGRGPFPTIVSVYGGPRVQQVTNGWNMTCAMRVQYLRSQGFLVFVLDNRGTSRRGSEFESEIHLQMGTVEVDDQALGIRWLIENELADPQRIGVYGWSYGGYVSLMCLLKYSDLIKVAVAGAPVTSWDGYDTHYTERYMRTPEYNPKGYKEGDVKTHVSAMRGKLLLIHGLIDENVHFRHTARLINALIKARKDYELLLFPDERHMPRRQNDRTYLETKVINFFQQNL